VTGRPAEGTCGSSEVGLFAGPKADDFTGATASIHLGGGLRIFISMRRHLLQAEKGRGEEHNAEVGGSFKTSCQQF